MSKAKALEILKMIKHEIPNTMGALNLNLLYDDICEVIKELEKAND